MPYTTLISAAELSRHLDHPNWVMVDCRFNLDDTEWGRGEYRQAHIPGAVYAHLDEHLSGPIIPGQTGRHPLPEVEVLAQTLSSWGIAAATQVVAYDAAGGDLAAARLWWMLRWLGHQAVAVLDGGWAEWQRLGLPERRGSQTRPARCFTPRPRPELVATAADVAAFRSDPTCRLFDSRSEAAYRGEGPSYDPIAGHIPGALSVPRTDNLDAQQRFRPQAELQARFQTLLGDVPSERAIFYCGSGVTAAHNVLALTHAGLGETRLYVGSWSDWILDPERPVARE
jgi:thiosulfate/3-mercaptopyruvate sulfurtransferase